MVVDEVLVEGDLFLLEVGDGLELNWRRPPPIEGLLLGFSVVVVVVGISVVVVGSGVVVVVVSSSLISFKSGVLSSTLLKVSSSAKLIGADVVEGSSTGAAVGIRVDVVGGKVVSESTKLGWTGKRGTSLLPYRNTFETGFND